MRKAVILSAVSVAAILVLIVSCSTPPPPTPKVNAEANRAKEIVQGTSTPDFPVTTLPQPGQSPGVTAQGIVQQAPIPGQTQAAAVPGAELSAEERAFLANYLSRLSYMVYYNDASGMDPRFARMAVTQANRYLIEKMGMSVIDFDQIEKNKKDQLDVYQTETGGSIGMIQYLAQKFNADVYVEIDLKASGAGGPGSYSGTVQGTMKLFETSTAQLLGSIAFNSPPTFSPVSQDGAISNAITASVWQAMPRMTEQAKALLGAAFSKGIRYELVVQGLPDAKQVSVLVKALSRKFGEVEQLSFASGDTRIALFGFMTKAKVQEAIYDAAATALLPDMYMVYMRGKSFTFNSGL